MTITTRTHRMTGGFFGRLLSASLSVWLLGVACTPVSATAAASVPVDQQPLIIQKALPPNITLMLDDSGSMASDYMPDWGYLQNRSNNDAVIDANNNGVYYNPTVTYTPPVKADGTSYPNATGLTNAWVDGFSASNTSSNGINLTAYAGNPRYDGSASPQNIVYSPYTFQTANYNNVTSIYDCYSSHFATQAGGFDLQYNSNTDVCTVYYNQAFSGFFQYSTGAASGAYSVHYVAATTAGCGTLNSTSTPITCVGADDTSGAAAPVNVAAGQNIANWFAYYHTRILMAKSGLMNSFSSVDSAFRVGFGSINGNNVGGLPSPTSSFNSKTIANVKAFGDGSAGTQKKSFWDWLVGESPSNSTPLRASLDAVGRYYKTNQPWQTSSTDTTELACRQSYTILTTDGFWNGPNPGNPNVDGTDGAAVTGPNGQSYTYKALAPYSDANSDTLADVAMKYWETDLRTAANEVPTSTEDPAFWQHMTTFTLGLGFTPKYADKTTSIPMDDVFKWANGGAAISGFSWPTPDGTPVGSGGSLNNIADLAHAAVNGHGGFYSATSPQAFASGLKDALKRAAERVGTGASLAANSTQLKSGAMAYQANYYTGKWKGDLKAFAVDANYGTLATTPTWTAVGAMPAFGARKIYTNDAATTPSSVEFTAANLGSLSTAEQKALGTAAADQTNMINYLRGDSTLEQKNTGGTYRNRDTPLGDIVDSQPVYVGAPDANEFIGETFTGSDTFPAYASSSATAAAPVILVAANDGMAHAFDAGTGAEKYAYLPAAVITNKLNGNGLASLASPDYGTTTAVPHQYFNDGELTVADVYNTATSKWQTVAVGTTGRGNAKAIYALDVTDPATFKLLWERSAGDSKTNSDYIGQMTGKPVIAQTANGVWSVLMGNGYNSAQGKAALLQFAIADGTLTVHATDSTTSNGLAAPAVWLGDLTNGISTIAYAGDLQGQVWSFDLNTGSTSATATPSSNGTKLYIAKDSAGKAQPITAGMLLGKNPSTGDLWVFFGTGQYLSSADLATSTTQTWYGLIVSSTTKYKGSNIAIDSSSDRTDLVQRSIIAETPGTAEVLNADGTVQSAAIAPARAVTALTTTPDLDGKSGWYIDLLSPSSTTSSATPPVTTYTPNAVAQGERIVTPNQFQGNQLLATTRIPQATDVCNPSGRGWIMAVDPFTGTSPTSSFFDLNGDGYINQPADWIMVGGTPVPTSGIGFSSLPNNPIFVGGSMLVSFDNGSTGSINTSASSGATSRVSWRELINQ